MSNLGNCIVPVVQRWCAVGILYLTYVCHSLNPKAGSTRKEGYHTDKLNALPFYEGNACIYYIDIYYMTF